MSYLYRSFEPGLYTVGSYTPTGEWLPESDHDTCSKAALRVAELNGGSPQASNAAIRTANAHIRQLCNTVNTLAGFRKVRFEDFEVQS
jgi:hypothetical protein